MKTKNNIISTLAIMVIAFFFFPQNSNAQSYSAIRRTYQYAMQGGLSPMDSIRVVDQYAKWHIKGNFEMGILGGSGSFTEDISKQIYPSITPINASAGFRIAGSSLGLYYEGINLKGNPITYNVTEGAANMKINSVGLYTRGYLGRCFYLAAKIGFLTVTEEISGNTVTGYQAAASDKLKGTLYGLGAGFEIPFGKSFSLDFQAIYNSRQLKVDTSGKLDSWSGRGGLKIYL